MDWIASIQKAIDYVEEHILEPIDFEEVAKCAFSSSFNFQRVFGIMCGFTLGDYIRFRRLTLAGNELISQNVKIIDLAYKYGYDTPESFSRAFTNFHGICPSKIKKHNYMLKSFSRLFVKLTIDGGKIMDYKIEEKKEFKVIVKKKKVPLNQELTSVVIGNFWRECTMDGTISSICKYISSDNVFGDSIAGISFTFDKQKPEFPYGIGVSYNGMPIAEDDLEIEEIPARTYAIFKCIGKMPEAFQKVYHQIYSDFMPTSDYKPCGGPDFEVYPSDDVQNPNYTCEIWVAVEKK